MVNLFVLQDHAATHSLSLKTYYEAKVSQSFPSNISPFDTTSLDTNDESEAGNQDEIVTPTSSSPCYSPSHDMNDESEAENHCEIVPRSTSSSPSNSTSHDTNDKSEAGNHVEIVPPTSSYPSMVDIEPPIPSTSASKVAEPDSDKEEYSFAFYDVQNLENNTLILPALHPEEKRFKDFNKCCFHCRNCSLRVQSFYTLRF